MTIEIPEDYATRFELFTKVEAILMEAYMSDTGVSKQKIGQLFATVCVSGSCWKDPAFLVWAGMKGLARSGDFYKRWDDLANMSDLENDSPETEYTLP